MRRARQREMDIVNPTVFDQMANSLFFTKLRAIPVVRFGVDQASNIYTKVRDFNTLTHRSFELAENVTGAVVKRVSPLAQRGISIAGPSLGKIDTMAARGLIDLESKVPAINTAPENIIPGVTEQVKETVVAVRDRVTKSSERVLVSKPVQTYFDMLEYILGTAASTLDKVLPPSDGGKTPNGSSNSNGYPSAEKRAERGWWLLGQFFGLLIVTKDRIVTKFRSRVTQTTNIAEDAFKQAKNAMNNALQTPNIAEDAFKQGKNAVNNALQTPNIVEDAFKQAKDAVNNVFQTPNIVEDTFKQAKDAVNNALPADWKDDANNGDTNSLTNKTTGTKQGKKKNNYTFGEN